MNAKNLADRSNDDIDNAVREILADILAIDLSAVRIEPSSNLFDFGLDSINVVEIFLMLERRFDLRLDESGLGDKSVRAIREPSRLHR
ncbi:MAG: acyl carrier protein [Gammaproteobacteria bacterium]|nr:acyl carrier protein [Gammaproteobacteria bacterium]